MCKRWIQFIKPSRNELGELRGRAHRLRQSAVFLYEEAVVLGTPPGTDAVQYGFHLVVERLCLDILTEDFTPNCMDGISVKCNACTREASFLRVLGEQLMGGR